MFEFYPDFILGLTLIIIFYGIIPTYCLLRILVKQRKDKNHIRKIFKIIHCRWDWLFVDEKDKKIFTAMGIDPESKIKRGDFNE